MKLKFKLSEILIYIILAFTAVFCIIPFLLVISGSLSKEEDIIRYGFSLIPRNIVFDAYRVLFINIKMILNGYFISVITTLSGTAFGLLICSMLAYPMAHKGVKFRKGLSVYSLITILFNGGIVSWYIICSHFLKLTDTIPALVLPYLVNVWYVFLLRNYFQSIPEEMYESAKIDGASEYRTFFMIIMPLSKPALATIALFLALGYWNDWWLGLMLINNTKLQPVQLILRAIESNVSFLTKSGDPSLMAKIRIPAEGVRMATCIITIGPLVFLYPFLQRYFVKGIMIGAVKG